MKNWLDNEELLIICAPLGESILDVIATIMVAIQQCEQGTWQCVDEAEMLWQLESDSGLWTVRDSYPETEDMQVTVLRLHLADVLRPREDPLNWSGTDDFWEFEEREILHSDRLLGIEIHGIADRTNFFYQERLPWRNRVEVRKRVCRALAPMVIDEGALISRGLVDGGCRAEGDLPDQPEDRPAWFPRTSRAQRNWRLQADIMQAMDEEYRVLFLRGDTHLPKPTYHDYAFGISWRTGNLYCGPDTLRHIRKSRENGWI